MRRVMGRHPRIAVVTALLGFCFGVATATVVVQRSAAPPTQTVYTTSQPEASP